ncbi:flagellar biosynthetic protein FliO [Phyllobacterium leguminum]|uniref:Flagellar biosynthesis protein FliO n=1 Tax=Phyllobacterium leguminum TaxID=314237 RepID=A0A318TA99_9HYPH|nr:flagellar biosynthetic protein FliO [Phyllobacterium leguminum]PYE89946.1 flagellar biosynthesis protein FliO [Phyllobacterium leguminum]
MYEWLSGIVGENAARIAGFVCLFLLVLLAIVVVLGLIRRFAGGTFVAGGRGRAPRLSVMDAAAVDSRRRLVLVRRDDVEHLLLIGGPTDIVVEQNIHSGTSANAVTANDRIPAANPGREPRAERTATPVSPPLETREAEPSIEPAPAAHVTPPTPANNPAPVARQQAPASVTPFPEKPSERTYERAQERAPERPRPTVAAVRPPVQSAVRPVMQPVQAPAAPRPAPQFSQPPRPAPIPPQTPRAAAPQPGIQSVRAHPAYPLSQVAQGVISATSGATLASGGAASLNIAPSREMPQAEPVAAKAPPSFPDNDISPDIEIPNERPSVRSEESSVTPFPSVSHPKEDISDRLDTFSDELHDALFDEFTIDDIEPEEYDKPTSELNIFPGAPKTFSTEPKTFSTENELEEESISELEDEMEKLLGELSRSRGS